MSHARSITLCCCFVVCLIGHAGAATAYFASGDCLPGTVAGIDKEGVRFESPALASPALIDLDMLLELRGEAVSEDVDADHEAIVTLTNGNVLRGQVGALDSEVVVLDTWYAGRLSLQRKMVDSLRVTDRALAIYSGPRGPEGWVMTGEGDPAWHFDDPVMRSDRPGGVGREFELPDRISVAFDLAWRATLRFRLAVFSDQLDDDMPPNAYVLDFNRHYVQFLKHRTVGNELQRSTVGNAGVRQLREREKVRVEFFADRKEGVFVLVVDGDQVEVWRDPEADKEVVGGGIQFISEDSAPIRVSRLNISTWDGRVDREDEAANGELDGEIPAGSQQIRLRNGDLVTGKVLGVENERLSIETKHATIRLPVGRMSTAMLHRAEDRENIELYQRQKLMNGDVRAWFPEGGCIVFRLDGVEGDRFIGFNQAFGMVKIRRDVFSRIEFNIYDDELEPLRPPASGW